MNEDSSPETTPEPEPQPTPEPEPTPDAPPAAPDPAAAPAPTPGADDPSQENPVMAALAYIVCVIIPIVILATDMKKSRYMRFHAFHSLFLTAAYVAISILFGVISAIPIIGIVAFAGCLVYPALIVLSIILAVKAYNKQEMLLPVIGQMAADQADKMKV